MTSPSTNQITLRPASSDDWKLLLEWRNDPATLSASRDTSIVDETAHKQWLRGCLKNKSRQLLIAELDGVAVGTVRLDNDETCEVSWTVAPHARGKGIGRQIVSMAVATVNIPMKAVARVENIGSQKIAQAAGFRIMEDDGEWLTYHRTPGVVELSHE